MNSEFGRTSVYVYGIILVIILLIVVFWVSCDLGTMPENYCKQLDGFIGWVDGKLK